MFSSLYIYLEHSVKDKRCQNVMIGIAGFPMRFLPADIVVLFVARTYILIVAVPPIGSVGSVERAVMWHRRKIRAAKFLLP